MAYKFCVGLFKFSVLGFHNCLQLALAAALDG